MTPAEHGAAADKILAPYADGTADSDTAVLLIAVAHALRALAPESTEQPEPPKAEVSVWQDQEECIWVESARGMHRLGNSGGISRQAVEVNWGPLAPVAWPGAAS